MKIFRKDVRKYFLKKKYKNYMEILFKVVCENKFFVVSYKGNKL